MGLRKRRADSRFALFVANWGVGVGKADLIRGTITMTCCIRFERGSVLLGQAGELRQVLADDRDPSLLPPAFRGRLRAFPLTRSVRSRSAAMHPVVNWSTSFALTSLPRHNAAISKTQ
jgi:hypothetical protein